MQDWLASLTYQDQMSDLIGQLFFWIRHSTWTAVPLLVLFVTVSGFIYYTAQSERVRLKEKNVNLIFSFPTWWFALIWIIYVACNTFPGLNPADTYAFSVYLLPIEVALLSIGVWTTAGQSFKLSIPISVLRFSLVGLPIIIISFLIALVSKILVLILAAVAMVLLFIFLI